MDTRTFVIAFSTVATLSLHAAVVTAAPSPVPSVSPAAAAEKTVTTESGLRYVDVKEGTGPTPKEGESVAIAYTIATNGKRLEGTKSSSPFVFALGRGQALKALDEGVSTMKVGGQRKLTVPPALGYGAEGVPGRIPPNAVLEVEIELLEIKK